MNNPLTFQQELHSMSLSELINVHRFYCENYSIDFDDPFMFQLYDEIVYRINTLKTKFEDDNKAANKG